MDLDLWLRRRWEEGNSPRVCKWSCTAANPLGSVGESTCSRIPYLPKKEDYYKREERRRVRCAV